MKNKNYNKKGQICLICTKNVRYIRINEVGCKLFNSTIYFLNFFIVLSNRIKFSKFNSACVAKSEGLITHIYLYYMKLIYLYSGAWPEYDKCS